ncbi:unnamed protein product [Oikopleura dioica]|uniref:Endonuclease III homolog n=1 Tax=Oikopleura dioica TaxID=34765 RepID=E4XBE5_OIKDI|nr:unnamed protein product [Oikopleura dioica]
MQTRKAIKRAISSNSTPIVPKAAPKVAKAKKIKKELKIEIVKPQAPPETSSTLVKPKLQVVKTEHLPSQEAPDNWETLYRNIQEMRSKADAPVDTMGCTELYSGQATPVEKRFQILISLLMSSQTKDEINAGAMKRLNEHFKSFNAEKAANADTALLSSLITPVGFHKTKSKNIVKVGEICRDQYSSDIPDTIEDLVKLPGIGPKMGYLALSCAWGKNEGIGVDVHVHRICQRLRFTKKPKNPEATRNQLESWLPKEKWQEINKLLVGFGQQICSAKSPNCTNCLNDPICPKDFSGEKISPKK